jgi:hypothetical protein
MVNDHSQSIEPHRSHRGAPAVRRNFGFSHAEAQILIRNVGFDAPFARPTRDHSRILARVPKDVDKDRGDIRLLFGWAAGLPASTSGR